MWQQSSLREYVSTLSCSSKQQVQGSKLTFMLVMVKLKEEEGNQHDEQIIYKK